MDPWQLGSDLPVNRAPPENRKRKHAEQAECSTSSAAEPTDALSDLLTYASIDHAGGRFTSKPSEALKINKIQADVVRKSLQRLEIKYDAIEAEQLSYYDDSLSGYTKSTMQADPTLTRLGYVPMLKLLSSRDYISYEDIISTSMHESHRATHGMSDALHNRSDGHRVRGRELPFFVSCNYNSVASKHLIENCEALMKTVPFGTGSYDYVPEQRLQMGFMASEGLPEAVRTSVSSPSELLKTEITGVTMESWTRPEIELWDNSTGAGKTSVLISTMMLQVSDPMRWQKIVDGTERRLRRQLRRSHLGLITGGNFEKTETAKVVLCFIPDPLMNQWEATANDVKAGFERDLGLTFDIWIGTTQYIRGTSKKMGVDKTLALAHSLNKPIIWIMKAHPSSADKSIRSSPHLHYFCRVYDEMTQATEKRSAAPESIPVRQVILIATVPKLEDTTNRQRRHPLSLALRGESYSSRNIEHAAIFRQASIPSILRELVCEGIGRTMPVGVHVNRISIKCGTLSGRLTRSDLNFQTLDQILTQLLTTAGCGPHRDEFKPMLVQVERVLAPQADGEAIVDRLRRALTSTDETILNLTPPVPPRLPDGSLSAPCPPEPPELSAYKALKRVLTKLQNALFGKLGEDGEIPTDPITFEEIEPKDVSVLFCCTQIISKQSLETLRAHGQRCPLCRQPNPTSFALSSTLEELSKQPVCVPVKMEVDGSCTSDSDTEEDTPLSKRHSKVGDEARLIAFFSDLGTSQEQFSTSFVPITQMVNAQLDFAPRSRILLAYYIGYNSGENEFSSAVRTSQLIKNACPRLDWCQGLNKRNPSAMQEFESADGGARMLLINLSDTSDSLVGINLGKADLLIMDASSRAISPSTLEQLQGRIMRPQVESRQVGRFTLMDRHEKSILNLTNGKTCPHSKFKSKRIVMLTSRNSGR